MHFLRLAWDNKPRAQRDSSHHHHHHHHSSCDGVRQCGSAVRGSWFPSLSSILLDMYTTNLEYTIHRFIVLVRQEPGAPPGTKYSIPGLPWYHPYLSYSWSMLIELDRKKRASSSTVWSWVGKVVTHLEFNFSSFPGTFDWGAFDWISVWSF